MEKITYSGTNNKVQISGNTPPSEIIKFPKIGLITKENFNKIKFPVRKLTGEIIVNVDDAQKNIGQSIIPFVDFGDQKSVCFFQNDLIAKYNYKYMFRTSIWQKFISNNSFVETVFDDASSCLIFKQVNTNLSAEEFQLIFNYKEIGQCLIDIQLKGLNYGLLPKDFAKFIYTDQSKPGHYMVSNNSYFIAAIISIRTKYLENKDWIKFSNLFIDFSLDKATITSNQEQAFQKLLKSSLHKSYISNDYKNLFELDKASVAYITSMLTTHIKLTNEQYEEITFKNIDFDNLKVNFDLEINNIQIRITDNVHVRIQYDKMSLSKQTMAGSKIYNTVLVKQNNIGCHEYTLELADLTKIKAIDKSYYTKKSLANTDKMYIPVILSSDKKSLVTIDEKHIVVSLEEILLDTHVCGSGYNTITVTRTN